MVDRIIGIVGAGLMGTGIAEVSLQKGLRVCLVDKDTSALQKAKKRLLGEGCEQIDKVELSDQLAAVKDCSLVVEAVYEDLELKKELMRSLELSTAAILASNTSAFRIESLAEKVSDSSRLIGMHYFSPVPKMPLVEIVKGSRTSEAALNAAVELSKLQGKKSIIVKDGPGFYTTRILSAYLDEALYLALEGIPLKDIDELMEKTGFPLGPFALMDEVGIDVVCHVGRYLREGLGERLISPHWVILEELLQEKHLGKKAGQGFYAYGSVKWWSKREKVSSLATVILQKCSVASPLRSMTNIDIQHRLLYRFINEAHHCWKEGIIIQPKEGDLAALLAFGFPASLGGPFAYIEQLGEPLFAKNLLRLERTFGNRFQA